MRLSVLGALLSFSAAISQAGLIVVPNSLASVEGNGNNSYPFGINGLSASTQRYQQVYAASQFGSGGLITQISFRPDGPAGGAFSTTISNIRIDLSTTSQIPDGISNTFANNVGADDMIVFSGSLSFSSSYTGPAGGTEGI